MVPLLVSVLGFDIRTSVAASLLAVVATSTAAGIAYVDAGLTNMRLGLALEIPTTIGAVSGGLIAISVSPSVTAAVFSGVMVALSILMWRHVDQHRGLPVSERDQPADVVAGLTANLLSGAFTDGATGRTVRYSPHRLTFGSVVSMIAGVLSGLLGVGGGFLKVPAMTLAMHVPTKAAAATSNFMIGMTAIASLAIYVAHGYMRPMIAVPVVLGVFVGAIVVSRLTSRAPSRLVTRALAVVMILVAVQMGFEVFGAGSDA